MIKIRLLAIPVFLLAFVTFGSGPAFAVDEAAPSTPEQAAPPAPEESAEGEDELDLYEDLGEEDYGYSDADVLFEAADILEDAGHADLAKQVRDIADTM